LTLVDKWIISRLQHAEAEVTRGFESYRFDRSATAIYEFVWNEYCDWYLELCKPVLNSDDTPADIKAGTRRTLVRVLETAMRLAHPVMPFITEEIWHKVAPLAGKEAGTIMLEAFPVAQTEKINPEAEAGIKWVQEFILSIRKIRGEMDIAPGKPLEVYLANASEADKGAVETHLNLLKFVGRVGRVTVLDDESKAPESAVALIGDLKVLIPLAGLIDKDAELARLGKEIEKAKANIQRTQGKLSNANFTDKAPPAVVDKEREKLLSGEKLIENLNAQLLKIQAL
ncbi:MAG: class I tRNA ligase family protein, partial [Proteobacteria bacterium]|nr:class I tRNA ligase family protein [Pseudomonadota bacterium]